MSALPKSKDIPESFRQRWLAVHEDCVAMKETIKTLNDKFAKSKQVCTRSVRLQGHGS